MANACEFCGKSYGVGNKVSHSNRKSLRRFNSNIQKKKMYDPAAKKTAVRKVCTRCLKTYGKRGGILT